MDKIYNPKDIEQPIYEYWESKGFFRSNNDTWENSYCIIIPPPNITGSLHMGHAFQHTIMDTLIRYQRMQGKNVLLQPGTDHAGIATQMIVERKIAEEEGINRHDYGRNALIKRIWQWKEESNKNIIYQMRRLGNSANWEQERFTMDDGISKAVKEVFVSLYQENLIYRGKKLVNWDPKLRTAISDLEVENHELQSSTWYLKYPLIKGTHTLQGLDYLIVATTRPETIFGDTGIAVNPKDPRYNDLIGQFVNLPIVNRLVPIIGDKHADIEKGTGCVKITPAHDFKDYELAKRHSLPMINILTTDGRIRQKAEIFDINGKPNNKISSEIPLNFRGLDRFAARKAIVMECDQQGLLVEIKTQNIIVPCGDRSGAIIEPMLTDQWFLCCAPLAKRAIKAVENGDINFIPKQYENMYFSWMKNLQDWCISRQLWWGHRIPAWYDDKNKIYVGLSEAEVRQQYKLGSHIILRQDEDVLDTWFSSGLWTFAALGWPENIEMLQTFHPTKVVISGFDIIFFWIARMIMLTMHFIKNKNGNPSIPFKTIYITGLIRDENGQKMSKSKGNIINPLDLIDGVTLSDLIKKRTTNMMQSHLSNNIRMRTEKQFPNGIKSYGTDALRFTLIALASTGRDINWDMKRLEGYRNFCNKLWNAARFVMIHISNEDCSFNDSDQILLLPDRWIIIKFNQTVKTFREAIDNYRFDLAATVLYEFIWNQFCDWYLELTKITINNNDISECKLRGTRHTLINILEKLLKLAHPIIPFITEFIWQKLNTFAGKSGTAIMLESFPSYNPSIVNYNDLNSLEWIKQFISTIRKIRIKMNVSSNKKLPVLLRYNLPKIIKIIKENLNFILIMGQIDSINFISETDETPLSFAQFIDGTELLIPMINLVNKEVELERLTKEIVLIERRIDSIIINLNNKNFVNRAPAAVVEKEINKLQRYQKIKTKLLEQKNNIASL